jgi:hypothetical protein
MAGYRYYRKFEPPGQILHTSGFAAAGRAFQQQRKLIMVGGKGNLYFIALRNIKGFLRDDMFFETLTDEFFHIAIRPPWFFPETI